MPIRMAPCCGAIGSARAQVVDRARRGATVGRRAQLPAPRAADRRAAQQPRARGAGEPAARGARPVQRRRAAGYRYRIRADARDPGPARAARGRHRYLGAGAAAGAHPHPRRRSVALRISPRRHVQPAVSRTPASTPVTIDRVLAAAERPAAAIAGGGPHAAPGRAADRGRGLRSDRCARRRTIRCRSCDAGSRLAGLTPMRLRPCDLAGRHFIVALAHHSRSSPCYAERPIRNSWQVAHEQRIFGRPHRQPPEQARAPGARCRSSSSRPAMRRWSRRCGSRSSGWRRCAPRFVSVTYGADGSTRERTHNVVTRVVKETLADAGART